MAHDQKTADVSPGKLSKLVSIEPFLERHDEYQEADHPEHEADKVVVVRNVVNEFVIENYHD